MNILCAVAGHKWELHNTTLRGDWKSCARCGKEKDFHPSEYAKRIPTKFQDGGPGGGPL